jgi:hypothetical protein
MFNRQKTGDKGGCAFSSGITPGVSEKTNTKTESHMSRTAFEFLNEVLTTPRIEAAAVASHNGWKNGKQRDLENPAKPFLGAGTDGKRARVRDFTRQQLVELLMREGKPETTADADGGQDVYNPIFVEFQALPTTTQGQNVAPMLATCYGLARSLSPDATLEDLKSLLENVISGTDQEAVKTVNRENHTAFQSFQLALGARGYGENKRDDFVLFDTLTKEVQALDGYTSEPAAKVLLELVNAELNS